MYDCDLNINQGSSLNLIFNAVDISGNLLNLSGYSAIGGIKYNPGDTGYLVDFFPQINLAVSGQIVVTGNPIGTGIPVTRAIYDIFAISSGGFSQRVTGGYVNIFPQISTY